MHKFSGFPPCDGVGCILRSTAPASLQRSQSKFWLPSSCLHLQTVKLVVPQHTLWTSNMLRKMFHSLSPCFQIAASSRDLFFKLLFGCPTADSGPSSGRRPRSRGVNHLRFAYSARGRLVGFEPVTFWFWSQRLNPQGHSPQILARITSLFQVEKTLLWTVSQEVLPKIYLSNIKKLFCLLSTSCLDRFLLVLMMMSDTLVLRTTFQ